MSAIDKDGKPRIHSRKQKGESKRDYMDKRRIDNVLRDALERSGKTLSQLAKEARVEPASLSRFMSEQREVTLETAGKLIEALGLDLTLVKFLRTREAVHLALEQMISQTREQIRVVGGKSRGKQYLEAIERAVTERSISYHRLLTGPDITHELHEHLAELLGSPVVQIRTAGKVYFGHMTITDRDSLLLLPSARKEDFFALRFSGYVHSVRFTEYFSELFNVYGTKSDRVEDMSTLARLCDTCSKRQ